MSSTFTFTSAELASIASQLLDAARRQGATQASVSLSESTGLSTQLYQGRVRDRMHHASQSAALTVYVGQRTAEANGSDFSARGLDELATAACAIARRAGEDSCVGLAAPSTLCVQPRELDLCHPWPIDLNGAIAIAHDIERSLVGASPDVCSNGVSVGGGITQYLLATSDGFCHGYALSQYGMSASALAVRGASRQLESWGLGTRNPAELRDAAAIGAVAGRRAHAMLDAKTIPSRDSPVVFEAKAALSLLGHLSNAANGDALYSGSSFLKDGLSKPLFADHVDVREDPFVPAGLGSAPFDADGVEPEARDVIKAGVLEGCFLSTYAARRLDMRPTGHAGRLYNLKLSSAKSQPADDLATLLRRMGTGLLVTGLSGQGVRMLTGDYSRPARGFWVEGGEIVHPVDQVTLAGNLRQIFGGIQSVGSDTHTEGSLTSGSVLVDRLHVAGA